MKIEDRYQTLISLSSEYARLVEKMLDMKKKGFLFPKQDRDRMTVLKGRIIQIEMADKLRIPTQQTIFHETQRVPNR